MKKIIILKMSFLFLSLTACKQSAVGTLSYNSRQPASSENSISNIESPITSPAQISSENVPSMSDDPMSSKYKWIRFPWDGKHSDYKSWNKYTYSAIKKYGQSLIAKRPSDIKEFCPNYDKLNEEGKIMFWIGLLSSMSKFESTFNPKMEYKEDFTDSTGRRVISAGLLQLSYESARAYGCPIKSTNDLKNAEVNLSCSVRIMNRWVSKDYVISDKSGSWRGGARYWAVLRRSSMLNSIQDMTSSLEVCN